MSRAWAARPPKCDIRPSWRDGAVPDHRGMAAPRIDTAAAGPWFRQRPRLALGVSAALFAVVFVVRVSIGGMQDSITLLYVLPVALLAMAFGLRAGVAASVGAVGLIVGWVLLRDVDFTLLAWFSRILPLVLLGVLVGTASDAQNEAEERELELAALEALQRESAEINDTVVQGLAAAKWLLEMGHIDEGIEVLTETMCETQALVAHLLGSDSPLNGGSRKGKREVPSLQ